MCIYVVLGRNGFNLLERKYESAPPFYNLSNFIALLRSKFFWVCACVRACACVRGAVGLARVWWQ